MTFGNLVAMAGWVHICMVLSYFDIVPHTNEHRINYCTEGYGAPAHGDTDDLCRSLAQLSPGNPQRHPLHL